MYAYTDFQGSLSALTDESGNVLEKYAFNPWGNRRDPDDCSLKDSRTSWLVGRGYTLHKHLDAFGIINMNGSWLPGIDVGAYVFPGETLPYIIPH